MNLVPLPVSMRTIFLANLVAVLFLVGLIAVDVNAASSILFPLVVGATQSAFLFFLRFAAVHALGVVLASVFSFFAVFSVLGLGMALLPPRAFKNISPYIRTLVVTYLVTLLCTSFALPDLLHRQPGSAPTWMRLLPSCWFLGLSQLLLGHADRALLSLARYALPGFGTVMALSFCVYAAGYRRHFVRIAEMTEGASTERAARQSAVGSLDRWCCALHFKRLFSFVWKTVLRSEAHRLVLAGSAGWDWFWLRSPAPRSRRRTWSNALVSGDGLSFLWCWHSSLLSGCGWCLRFRLSYGPTGFSG
jgi:hypothetical protein